MSETFPISDTPDVSSMRSRSERANRYALKSAILQFLQPGVLPVLALALIVGGWSYGLKLSHYFHHTDVTKASTTRMWLDHRNDGTIAPVLHHQKPVKFLAPQISFVSVAPLPHFSLERTVGEPAPRRIIEFVSPLHPLRAPPLFSLLA